MIARNHRAQRRAGAPRRGPAANISHILFRAACVAPLAVAPTVLTAVNSPAQTLYPYVQYVVNRYSCMRCILLHEAQIRVRNAPARHLLTVTPRSIWRCRWLSRVGLLGASANILALGPTVMSARRPSRRFGRGALADERVPAETKNSA